MCCKAGLGELSMSGLGEIRAAAVAGVCVCMLTLYLAPLVHLFICSPSLRAGRRQVIIFSVN